ncbi:hypothetical protein E2C01_043784 [Portunus trituberculatus]|uniref:Uncharacterized protein n=1 Tax=Portunus trituberculatus TaxID=210409 RepID=A0A5B7FYN1_PORTR|nr:hypothetical protein [Portunus trituberculatus]
MVYLKSVNTFPVLYETILSRYVRFSLCFPLLLLV